MAGREEHDAGCDEHPRRLLVTPSPMKVHQVAVLELAHALRLLVPPGMRVLVAPMDVRFSIRRQVQPDVLVIVDGPMDVRL